MIIQHEFLYLQDIVPSIFFIRIVSIKNTEICFYTIKVKIRTMAMTVLNAKPLEKFVCRSGKT